MNPNFHTNQLKDDFIEVMRESPCIETLDAYNKGIYEQTTEAPDLLKWDLIHYFPTKYTKEVISLGGGGYVGYLLLTYSYNVISLLVSIMLGLLCAWLLWWLLSERCFHYRFNNKHIAIHRYRNLLKHHFLILRGIAWVGVGACLIAFFEIGLVAFVGAGGAALLAFKAVNIKRDDELYYVIPYDSILFIELIRDSNQIEVCYKCQSFGYLSEGELAQQAVKEEMFLVDIYCEKLSTDEVLNFIKHYLHDGVEIFETATKKEKVNIYRKALDSDVTLREIPL